MNNPTIVVVAFNRLHSLKRLCSSLDRMVPPEDEANLVFSIDNNENKNLDVIEYAKAYSWKHGKKEVRVKEKNIGLRAHILSCGDLTEEFGEVIILEDDLYVSPYFLEYTRMAHNFYKNDKRIGGISLYHYQHTDAEKIPFAPLTNESDVYFLQVTSSWGQSWNRNQWQNFRKWYNANPDLESIQGVPAEVLNWPATSWKRYFNSYLIDTKKYFVFPVKSFTTNFNDPGMHYLDRDHEAQAPLVTVDPEFRFKKFDSARNIYDPFFEIIPDTIKHYNEALAAYDFDVDIYGTKRIKDLVKPFVITTKKCRNPIFTFERSLKPQEMNVMFAIPGNDIFLCKNEDLEQEKYEQNDIVRDFPYFFRHYFNRSELTLFFKLLINNKLNRILKK
jgi:hypothetical protein